MQRTQAQTRLVFGGQSCVPVAAMPQRQQREREAGPSHSHSQPHSQQHSQLSQTQHQLLLLQQQQQRSQLPRAQPQSHSQSAVPHSQQPSSHPQYRSAPHDASQVMMMKSPHQQVQEMSRSEQRRLRLREIENELAAEEAEAIKLTEEQRQTLFRSFTSVKVEFSDLDGMRWTKAALSLFQMQTRKRPHPTSHSHSQSMPHFGPSHSTNSFVSSHSSSSNPSHHSHSSHSSQSQSHSSHQSHSRPPAPARKLPPLVTSNANNQPTTRHQHSQSYSAPSSSSTSTSMGSRTSSQATLRAVSAPCSLVSSSVSSSASASASSSAVTATSSSSASSPPLPNFQSKKSNGSIDSRGERKKIAEWEATIRGVKFDVKGSGDGDSSTGVGLGLGLGNGSGSGMTMAMGGRKERKDKEKERERDVKRKDKERERERERERLGDREKGKGKQRDRLERDENTPIMGESGSSSKTGAGYGSGLTNGRGGDASAGKRRRKGLERTYSMSDVWEGNSGRGKARSTPMPTPVSSPRLEPASVVIESMAPTTTTMCREKGPLVSPKIRPRVVMHSAKNGLRSVRSLEVLVSDGAAGSCSVDSPGGLADADVVELDAHSSVAGSVDGHSEDASGSGSDIEYVDDDPTPVPSPVVERFEDRGVLGFDFDGRGPVGDSRASAFGYGVPVRCGLGMSMNGCSEFGFGDVDGMIDFGGAVGDDDDDDWDGVEGKGVVGRGEDSLEDMDVEIDDYEAREFKRVDVRSEGFGEGVGDGFSLGERKGW
ncbi:hypothetical protein CVT24_002337 [Panaeolus cyanescens]|uniref:Uncharacterized protein n=1 Tax=Panaeolus cyanescens TaxID=181874 RepID=A0A409WJP3_9AGAR|nr:hypothetical protein CVT24_002337 [Panaeolus cyanescens]